MRRIGRRGWRALVAITMAGIAALTLLPAASAMTVTSTGETGTCTLKGAIAAVAANDNNTGCGSLAPSGPTPINLPANTYTLSSGQIVVPAGTWIEITGGSINDPLTTVIDGTNNVPWRVFEIKSGATVKMTGLTITGGRTSAGAPGDPGGGILNQGNLTLDHVVVTDNEAGDGFNGANGGLEQNGSGGYEGGRGGGIYNADNASLTITNSEISDNTAGDGGDGGAGSAGLNEIGHFPEGGDGGRGGPGGSGGGIYNSNFGTLVIDRTTISGNQSGRGGSGGAGHQGAGPGVAPGGGELGGAVGGDGGDGGNNGLMQQKDGSSTWDEARGGGGVYNLGYATITNSTVSGNNTGAGGNGGPSGAGGKASNSNNNFRASGRAGWGGGGGRGGGLLNGSWQQGRMWLTNVTVAGNFTGVGGTGGGGGGGSTSTLGGGKGGNGGDGGGIWGQGSHNNETLLTHVTITDNFVGGGGLGGSSAGTFNHPAGEKGRGAGLAAGARYNSSGAGVYLRKSLIAENGFPVNGDAQCFEQGALGGNIDIIDQGYSLEWNGTACHAALNGNPDLSNIGDYGGPTETIVPQPGSPAIGAVPLASCDITSDQRGNPRPGPDGSSCDIGAVETGIGPSSQPTTTSISSSLNPSKTGQAVTYTSTVSPPPSSGTVAFKDGGVVIPGCEAQPRNGSGQSTCTVTYPVIGNHSITAHYEGNTLFDASHSSALNQVVNNGTAPDTTPPDTLIDTGPSGTVFENSATFTFHGTPGDTARTQCRMDAGAFAECSSPKTYTDLGEGTHVFSVRAVDAIGNIDASPATRTFRIGVNTEPAKAEIGKVKITGPAKVKKGKKGTFAVKVTNAGDAVANAVKVKVRADRVRSEKSLGSVGSGKTEVARFRIRFTRKGPTSVLAKVTSGNAGGKTASKTVTVGK